jgi:3-demethoxyubiquinol 3-hydroxylase
MSFNFTDQIINSFDNCLRTLTNAHSTDREHPFNPDKHTSNQDLSKNEQQHIAGLMRVNHCGEVCAQALYQGQALTSHSISTQKSMMDASTEEIDHLIWCKDRLSELNSHTSLLNPFCYHFSFSLGAVTGLLGDKISLGFVASTEELVSQHLENHLSQLPENDLKSKAILETMLEDEINHKNSAMSDGGIDLPFPIKSAMSAVSKIMTKITYYI